jgi:UDP-N-acetylglucosamine diphosphorylase/glucosamine-1-phosphate N-acetyltransferase
MATTTPTTPKALEAIILAAGKGTRMESDLPKVCHPVGGRPMVCAVVDACFESGCSRVVVVVGYKQELVREALASYGDKVEFAVQHEQLGTGHAVVSAMDAFPSEQRAETDVFVLCGDGPLIRTTTLHTMLEKHRSTGADATLATSVIDDPDGYGRIVRDADNGFVRIVEQKNASEDELKINEVNPSYYCMNAQAMFEALKKLSRNELTGEYYITDVFEHMLKDSKRVEVIDAVPAQDILSINTLEHLAAVDAIYRARQSDSLSSEPDSSDSQSSTQGAV